MQNKFRELLMAKKQQGKVLKPEMAQHKMEVIENLMEAMGEDMGNQLKGMKKVTVAAPDKEGLEEGLEKAKEVVEEAPMEEESEDSEESDDSEESEDKIEEKESDEIAELKAKIAELQAKLGE